MKEPSVKLNQILTVPFAIMISFAIIITGYFTWHYSESFALDSGRHINQQTVNSIKLEIDYYFHHASMENNAIKRAISHELLDITDHKLTYNYLQEILDPKLSKGIIDNLHIGYPNGDYLGVENTKDGIVKRIADDSTDHSFQIINPLTGDVLKEKSNYYAQETNWYRQAKSSDKPVWSEVYPIFGTQHLGMTLSEAVYNDDGNFVCVVGADILMDDLNAHISELQPSANAHLYILDQDLNIISDSAKINYPEDNKTLLNVFDNPSQANEHSLLQQSLKMIGSLNDGFDNTSPVYQVATLTDNGIDEKYLFSYVPVGREYGLDWHIAVILPESDLIGHARTLELRTFFIWLLAFITSVIIGLLITRFINYSIQHLYGRVKNIRKSGSMFQHTDSRIKEVNELSVAFSQMSYEMQEMFLDLKNTNKELEKVVKERTHELEEANTKLKTMAETDELTQVLNLRGLQNRLTQYQQAMTSGEIDTLTCLVADLDNLKQINHHQGYKAGNQALIHVAATISEAVQKNADGASVVRTDGDKFIVLLADVTEARLENIKTKIMQAGANSSHPTTINIVINTINNSQLSTDEMALINFIEDTKQQLFS